jgi:maleate cis-trans isomerase
LCFASELIGASTTDNILTGYRTSDTTGETEDMEFVPVEGEEETVTVAGRVVPLSEVTEEDQQQMTAEEYKV